MIISNSYSAIWSWLQRRWNFKLTSIIYYIILIIYLQFIIICYQVSLWRAHWLAAEAQIMQLTATLRVITDDSVEPIIA